MGGGRANGQVFAWKGTSNVTPMDLVSETDDFVSSFSLIRVNL